MREIKFRAWSKQDKDLKNPQTLQEIHNEGIGLSKYGRVMMQFTELKDKNGEEIYEGDIIKYESKHIRHSDENEFKKTVVVFLKGGYYLETKSKAHFHLGISSESGEFEVIGNIYENPEILELTGESNG